MKTKIKLWRSSCFQSKFWRNVVGTIKKPKWLKLEDCNDFFFCPLPQCDSAGYHSKRRCRKHAFNKHGWFYYNEKSYGTKVFQSLNTSEKTFQLPRRVKTNTVSMFVKTSEIQRFMSWLQGGKIKGSSWSDIVRNIVKRKKKDRITKE